MGPGDVLLVEDAEVHVEFTRLAFDQQGMPDALRVVRDGESALALIDDPDGTPPRVVLLDLGLPRMSGFEVLEALRAHPDARVRRTPVVVLTTSRAPSDVARAYDLHASSFVSKPLDLDEFVGLIGALREWWLERVELPG
jgi:CheY-like chemotaxis protein